MSRNTLAIVGAAVIGLTILSAPLANAQQQNNPLHPTYFAAKRVAIHPISTDGVSRYVDAHNPLHPAFARAGEASNWDATGVAATQAYIDANNPLHPKYTHN
jgi:hypothetical protein